MKIRPVIERIPVLGLADYVLLPYTVTALHVFEPQAVDMVDDCQATDRLLVIANLAPEWFDVPSGLPAVRDIAGLGKVVNVQVLEDGTREVFLHGVARVRIARIIQERPQRLARVERDDDDPSTVGERFRQRGMMRRITGFLTSLAVSDPVHSDLLRIAHSAEDPAILSFRLAAALLRAPAERQRALECTSPAARLALLIDALAARLMDTHDRHGGIATDTHSHTVH